MPVDTSQRAATGTRCYGHLDPHDTFEAATERAQKRGMSRSEFFSLAVRRYLDELDRESITQQVDEALRAAGSDEAAAAVVAAGPSALSTVIAVVLTSTTALAALPGNVFVPATTGTRARRTPAPSTPF